MAQPVVWNSAKFQMNVKLAINRLKLQRTKLIEIGNRTRKEISDLLLEYKERVARAKTIALVHDEYMVEVLNILELYCQTLATRQAMIEASNTCPADLQVAVCSIIFAAPQVQVPELMVLRQLLLSKYGQKFMCHCVDYNCINPKVRDKLKRDQPADSLINLYLTNIAGKFGVPFTCPESNEPKPVAIQAGNIAPAHQVIQPIQIISSTTMAPPSQLPSPVSAPPTYKPTLLKSQPKNPSESSLQDLQQASSGDLVDFALLKEQEDEFKRLWDMTESLTGSMSQFAEQGYISGYGIESSTFQTSSQLHSQQPSRGVLHGSKVDTAGDSHSKRINVQSKSYANNPVNKQPIQPGAALLLISGSRNTKIGVIGEAEARFQLPSIIGVPKSDVEMITDEPLAAFYIGKDALDKKGVLQISYPIENGIVRKYQDAVKIWSFVFKKIGVNITQHPLVVAFPENATEEDKLKLQSVFKDHFKSPKVTLYPEVILALNATGRQTGLVLDCGSSVARLIPIHENSIVKAGTARFIFGGYHIESYLIRLFQEKGYNFISSSEKEIILQIKEEYVFIPRDFKAQSMLPPPAIRYFLPDGRDIILSDELYKAAEPFFEPSMVGITEKGLHHQVLLAILKCDVSIRRELLQNLVIVGGTSFLTGFIDRMSTELASIVPPGTVIDICAPDNRDVLSWFGGSALFSANPQLL